MAELAEHRDDLAQALRLLDAAIDLVFQVGLHKANGGRELLFRLTQARWHLTRRPL